MWPRGLVVARCSASAETWFESDGPRHFHSTLVFCLHEQPTWNKAAALLRRPPGTVNETRPGRTTQTSELDLGYPFSTFFFFCGSNHISHSATILQSRVLWYTLRPIWGSDNHVGISAQLSNYPLKAHRGSRGGRSQPYIKDHYWRRDDNTRRDERLSLPHQSPPASESKTTCRG